MIKTDTAVPANRSVGFWRSSIYERLGHLLLAAVIMLCVSVASCNRSFKNWPEPRLTLPPGSTTLLKRQYSALTPAEMPSGTAYTIYFDNSGSYADICSHVESCLKPLGYKRVSVSGAATTTTYVSEDGIIAVYVCDEAGSNSSCPGDYTITVVAYESRNDTMLTFTEEI